MELEILGGSRGEAVVDLDKFKQLLGKNWDLREAVFQSAKVIKVIDELKAEDFLQFIWLGMDWRGIIEQFPNVKKDKMTVRLFLVKYKDWVVFTPGKITLNQRVIVLKETKEKGMAPMLTQDYIATPSFAIKNFVNNSQFDYGKNNKWGYIIKEGK